MTGPDVARSMRRFYEAVLVRGGRMVPRGAAPTPDTPAPPASLGRSIPEAAGRHLSLAPALLVATTFVACAWLSWRRLGSLIVDGGHELEVPRRLLEGAALYRDIPWNWGPLAPWVNAALYRVFGVHSDTLMWAGLVSAALASLGLFLLARRFVGPFTSAWVAIAFIAACAFSRRGDLAIFNFVAPFNYSATYGITLAIWSVLLLVRHARSGEPATLTSSAVLAGLVALTKIEATLAVAVAHGAYLLTVLPRPSRGRMIAWGCGLAVAVLGYLVAAWTSQGAVWRSLVELVNGGAGFYIADSMGIRELGLSLVDVASSLLGWAVVLVALWLAARPGAGWHGRWLVPLALLTLLALLVVSVFVLERRFFVLENFFILEKRFFRAAPLLLAAGLAWIALARIRQGEAALEGRWREHLVVWAFALGALPRIFLRSGVDHYGFYLLPPTFVCVAIGIARYLVRPGGPSLSPRALSVGASTVLAGLALGGFVVCYPQLTKPMSEVRTARVHSLVVPGGPEAAFIPYLSGLPPSTVGAAVPEGAGIIFASGLTPTADGMTAYIPMQLHDPGVQRAILEAWERKPPEVIVYWGEDQSLVFGYAGFGKDYGLELAGWISARFEVAKQSSVGRAALLVRRHGARSTSLNEAGHRTPAESPPADGRPAAASSRSTAD
jgi:dolichyl-phosphate-mannose-protein mannosyltransferase